MFKEVKTREELLKDVSDIDFSTVKNAAEELIEENPELKQLVDEIVEEIRGEML